MKKKALLKCFSDNKQKIKTFIEKNKIILGKFYLFVEKNRDFEKLVVFLQKLI